MLFHGSAGSGSRSSTKRSGLSRLVEVAFQVCNSTVLICTEPINASALLTIMIGWPVSSLSSTVIPGIASFSAFFWKNNSPAMPSGARTSATGRSFNCGRIHLATLA
ncbi:hypothetical protein D3C73_1301350 [compost metagenome]